MSKTPKKQTSKPEKPKEKKPFFSKRAKLFFGVFLVLFSIALLFSFASHFLYGNYDQSILTDFTDRQQQAQNWLGKFGAFLADAFLYKGFGAASFLFVRLLFLTGMYMTLELSASKLKKIWFWDLFVIVVLSVLLGFFHEELPELGGVFGFEMNAFLQDYLGKAGTILVVLLGIVIYLIFKIRVSPEKVKTFFESRKKELAQELSVAKPKQVITDLEHLEKEDEEEWEEITLKTDIDDQLSDFKKNIEDETPTISNFSDISLSKETKEKTDDSPTLKIEVEEAKEQEFIVETAEEELPVHENMAAKLVDDFGEFDPTLELSNYQFPSIELLKDYGTSGITINQEELEENKNRIVKTLRDYKIEIAQIKATIGPTVTLYEIVPEAGIRISKIKSLEDDIALSLSALGIRIIAPIPGKGTIGIEVPNQKPTMVPMKSVISSPKFQTAEMELPVALGKTISNETFVVDLAKMPHLLMAGATGQGKSVGLNAVLTSLLYKKHPAEVKFVLVDPKKVELTLFNKIERHYLAKLPDTEDAIITDNTKVINTLNSLCIEMDNRYGLLKEASVRNIKEYNEK
ncbi:MAG: DNA translocase FtsK 4TM domain-containing protein, partial [Flavobacteriaceae bacterium]